jgi:hypothetical protein
MFCESLSVEGVTIEKEGDHGRQGGSIGIWEGVAMDSLKFHPGPLCPTPADGRPAAVLYPFGQHAVRRAYARR